MKFARFKPLLTECNQTTAEIGRVVIMLFLKEYSQPFSALSRLVANQNRMSRGANKNSRNYRKAVWLAKVLHVWVFLTNHRSYCNEFDEVLDISTETCSDSKASLVTKSTHWLFFSSRYGSKVSKKKRGKGKSWQLLGWINKRSEETVSTRSTHPKWNKRRRLLGWKQQRWRFRRFNEGEKEIEGITSRKSSRIPEVWVRSGMAKDWCRNRSATLGRRV